MRHGRVFILLFAMMPFLLTDCEGGKLIQYKKVGESIKLNFRLNADSILLVYRNYTDTIYQDTAVFIKGEGGHFKYEITPDINTNLVEYYIEDLKKNHYPKDKYFYAVFLQKKGKKLKYADLNYAKDLYNSGVRSSKNIIYYAKEELKLYPEDYSVYLFLDNIRYNMSNFNIRLTDMFNMAKKGTPNFFRTFTVIMSRYNMKEADSLFEVMLHRKIKPVNMIEYFGRASRDTAYIKSIIQKFPNFEYDIYKNCFIATVRYRIFKNFNYYHEKVLGKDKGDPEIYRYIVLSGRGDIKAAYEKLKKSDELTPEVMATFAKRLIPTGDKALNSVLKDIKIDELSPSMLNGISYEMAIHGVDISLAEKFIVTALNRFTLSYSFAKDFFSSFYKKRFHYYSNRAYMLDTYAYILLQKDDFAGAKIKFDKAIKLLNKIGEEDPTILEHYSYVMEKQKISSDSLVTLYGKILAYGKNENVLKKLHAIYIQKRNNDKGFKTYVNKLKRKYRALKRIDKAIKNYELTDVSNRTYNLRQFKGKTVILTIYKSECGFCKAEAIDLRRLQDKFKNSENVVFINITPDSRGKAIKFFKEYKLNAINVACRIDLVNELEVVGTPTNLIIGTDGRIHYIIKGYFTDFSSMIEELIKNELNIDQKEAI